MARVRIFQHEAAEGPGYLGELLEHRGFALDTVRIDRGARVNPDLQGLAGLVFLGGRTDPQADWPWMQEEMALMRNAAEAGLPILAHGLGAELLAQALGGTVRPNLVEQIGWFPLERIESASTPDWLGDLPARFDAFKWHRQSFELPPGAERILKSAWCPTEAWVRGDILALQAHLELTAPMLRTWVENYAQAIGEPAEEPSPESKLTLNWERIVQGPEQILLDLPGQISALHAIAECVYGGWIDRMKSRSA